MRRRVAARSGQLVPAAGKGRRHGLALSWAEKEAAEAGRGFLFSRTGTVSPGFQNVVTRCAEELHRSSHRIGTPLAPDQRMSFMILEGAALALAFLLGCEWHSQKRSWRFIVLGALIVLAVLNAMIVGWRGL